MFKRILLLGTYLAFIPHSTLWAQKRAVKINVTVYGLPFGSTGATVQYGDTIATDDGVIGLPPPKKDADTTETGGLELCGSTMAT